MSRYQINEIHSRALPGTPRTEPIHKAFYPKLVLLEINLGPRKPVPTVQTTPPKNVKKQSSYRILKERNIHKAYSKKVKCFTTIPLREL